MESINFAKGYDKVRSSSSVHLQLEDETDQPTGSSKPIRKSRFAVVSAAVILAFAVAFTLFALTHHTNTNTEPPAEPEVLPTAATLDIDPIRAVCNVTRYRDTCFATISAATAGNPNPVSDPEEILKVAIQVSLARFADLASLFRNTSSGGAAEWGSKATVDDCVELFEEGVSNLNKSLEAMEVGRPEGNMLTPEKIDDLKTWISAAMTDETTCGDGLSEIEAKVPDEVTAAMEGCEQLLSNSLAILANMPSLLHDFQLQMH